MKKIVSLILTLILAVFVIYTQQDSDYKQQQVNYDNEEINKINDNIAEDGEIARVVHIVDGDTFDIATGERIRMIGIDTPERGKYYYKEATQHLAQLIEGKEVILKKDVSETDQYGRLLRHVYVDDTWVNEQMVRDGYAYFVIFPPDVSHADIFKEAQNEARKYDRGLWN
jgi:micrococcal nuclease